MLDKPFVALATSNLFTSVLAYGMAEGQVASLHKGIGSRSCAMEAE